MMDQTCRYATKVRNLLTNGEGKLIHRCVSDEEQLLMTWKQVVLPIGFSFLVELSEREMLELEKLKNQYPYNGN